MGTTPLKRVAGAVGILAFAVGVASLLSIPRGPGVVTYLCRGEGEDCRCYVQGEEPPNFIVDRTVGSGRGQDVLDERAALAAGAATVTLIAAAYLSWRARRLGDEWLEVEPALRGTAAVLLALLGIGLLLVTGVIVAANPGPCSPGQGP